MVEFCHLCAMKCPERRFSSIKYCFGKNKKSLVAISLLVFIMMFLSLAEAAPRRPVRKEGDLINAEQSRSPRRHLAHRSQYHMLNREKKNKSTYKIITRKVHKKINNTLNHFKSGMKALNIIRNFTTGKPKWLPNVNFFNINNTINKTTDIRKRFKAVAQKLNQNLNDYKNMFELLLNMTVQADSNYYDELQKRQRFIESTLNNIKSAISELNDGLREVNMKLRYKENEDKESLIELKKIVDSTKYEWIMKVAFRGFENSLNKWTMGFNCWFSFDCGRFNRNVLGKRIRKKQ